MKITNSPRISAKQHILPGRCGHRPLRPLIKRTFSEFHTSNIQRAQTKRLARYIVRLGNPILRPPEGRSDDGNKTITRTTKRKAFQARKRYFVLRRLFFCILFSDKSEKSMPPEAFRTGWCRKMSLRRHSAPFRRRKDMARGAAATALQTAARLRRIRNDLLEAEHLYTQTA